MAQVAQLVTRAVWQFILVMVVMNMKKLMFAPSIWMKASAISRTAWNVIRMDRNMRAVKAAGTIRSQ